MSDSILKKGDRVRVKGLAGLGKVMDLWHQPGTGMLVKIGWHRPVSGRLVRTSVEPIANVTKVEEN